MIREHAMCIGCIDHFLSDANGRIGLFILLFFGMLAMLGPVLAPYSAGQSSGIPLAPPTRVHPLGVNDIGEDILANLLLGCRHSLIVGLAVGCVSVIISLVVGLLAALLGKVVDRFLMRLVDVLIALPNLLLFILISAYVRPSTTTLIVMLALLSWQYGARVIRGQAMVLFRQGHVLASRSFGGSLVYVTFRHVIPDLFPILVVGFVMRTRFAILSEAGLAFLGIGDPLAPSLGKMISACMEYIFLPVWAWWLLPAGLALSGLIVGFTLLGITLEKKFDPSLD
ncbi:MAG: ABC transporter permease [Deltaproteobacteria bacterium]|nr:ABC transporter permease [Deltaproteobacteria bacterium]